MLTYDSHANKAPLIEWSVSGQFNSKSDVISVYYDNDHVELYVWISRLLEGNCHYHQRCRVYASALTIAERLDQSHPT